MISENENFPVKETLTSKTDPSLPRKKERDISTKWQAAFEFTKQVQKEWDLTPMDTLPLLIALVNRL